MNMLGDEEKLANIIEVLASGEIPIAGIAQIILEDGFRKGKYNPDLMLLLAEPLMVILMALAERAGIRDYEIYQGEGSELSGEEQAELANDVINSYKEEVNFIEAIEDNSQDENHLLNDVKMIQLFYEPANEQKFRDIIEKVRDQHRINNISDAVLHCVLNEEKNLKD